MLSFASALTQLRKAITPGTVVHNGIVAKMDHKASDRQRFQAADANADGKLGRDEWREAGGTARRWRLAAGEDEVVTSEAYLRLREQERAFAALDRNDDGKLGVMELAGGRKCVLSKEDWVRHGRFDKNDDGLVSESEFIRGRQREIGAPAPRI